MTAGTQAGALGSGGKDVGELAMFWGAPDNFTKGAMEWLRTGVLKAIAGYSATVTERPGLGYVLATQKSATGNGSTIALKYDGSGRYFQFGGGSPPRTVTALTGTWAATTVDTDSTCYDAFSFNGRVIHLTASTSTQYTFNASGAATSFAVAGSFYCGAGNAANTLCHIVGSIGFAGGVYTSPDGTTFTSRTSTSTRSSISAQDVWQPLTNTFATLCTDGSVQTTADGYTYTDRGILANVTAVTQLATNAGVAHQSAANATATMFSALLNYNGVANTPALVTSTNGTTFTATPWATLLGFTPAVAPALTVTGGVFYATVQGNLITDRAIVYTSTNGAAWARATTPVMASLPTGYAINAIQYLNGEFVVLPTTASSMALATVPNFTATHIGLPRAAYGSIQGTDQANVQLHVRIK